MATGYLTGEPKYVKTPTHARTHARNYYEWPCQADPPRTSTPAQASCPPACRHLQHDRRLPLPARPPSSPAPFTARRRCRRRWAGVEERGAGAVPARGGAEAAAGVAALAGGGVGHGNQPGGGCRNAVGGWQSE